MSNFIEWLKTKQNSIIQLISAAIALGQLFGLWDLSSDQLAGIMAFVAALFLVVTGQTVTSNFRLADKGWSPGGVSSDEIAESPKTNLVEYRGLRGRPGSVVGRNRTGGRIRSYLKEDAA